MPALSSTEQITLHVLLAIVLVVAAYTDATRGKIYNLLTFPAILLGLILNWVFWREDGALQGLKVAGLGFAVGLALLFVPFALGGTKAGDVKFLAAVGAITGWDLSEDPLPFVLVGFLYGAVLFGVVAVCVLARRGKLGKTMGNISTYFYGLAVLQSRPELSPPADDSKYPYGISLALGFFLALGLEYWLGRPYFWHF